ncbi:hypothetical protein D3C79_844830 [compost metagenome]
MRMNMRTDSTTITTSRNPFTTREDEVISLHATVEKSRWQAPIIPSGAHIRPTHWLIEAIPGSAANSPATLNSQSST